MNTCATCRYFDELTAPENLTHEGECHANPPVTHLLAMPVQGIAGQGLNVQVLTVFPKVTEDKFCGSFLAKLND
jgi:hypothetical protein